MNRFTPTLVWLLMCLVFVLVNWNCSTTKKIPIARVPTKITSYPLIDYKGEEHKGSL